MKGIGICPLSSGSSGNSVLVTTGTANILVDCGLTGKAVETELKRIDFDPQKLDAIIVTHEHIDHISGVGIMSRRYNLGIVNIPCNEELGLKICRIMEDKGVHCVRGVIATGDAFIADEATKNDIAKTFNAIACDMEGASIALVSYMGNVKCVVMRTISDGAEGNDEYETNKDETAKKSTEALISVVEAI